MAKAQSPVRLQQGLMASAATVGSLFNRSAAEQVEYWATIGRSMQNLLGPDTLLDINAGVKTISVEEAVQVRLNPNDVFAAVERDRKTGALAALLNTGEVRYQASTSAPGLLEQISPDGSVLVGTFNGGVFHKQ